MDIIARLASQIGARGQTANVKVAERCIMNPDLLETVASRMADKDARLAGDCAEVLTKVAEQRPELVAPHAEKLFPLLAHRNGRVRWESAHALGLVASQVPRLIAGELENLGRIARRDESVIVRDYALDAIVAYAATGPKAAVAAFPFLRECAMAWNSKHAARILRGLDGLAGAAPKLVGDIRKFAAQFEEHSRPGVVKAAKSLLSNLSEAAGAPRPR
jgi:hypothetical protein